MQAKVNMYRDELEGLVRDLERAQLMARESNAVSSNTNQNSQYERLIKNNDRLAKSSKLLKDTHRIVAETEEVGIAVLDTLASQRESLLGAHEKVRETGAMTTEVRRILQRMTRRILTNTIVLYTTIFVLVVAICYVLYADFIRATPLTSAPPLVSPISLKWQTSTMRLESRSLHRVQVSRLVRQLSIRGIRCRY